MRNMTGRAVAEVLSGVAIAAALVLVGAGLLALDGAESPAAAFLYAGPRTAGTLLGIPFLIWAAALVLVALRGRRGTARGRLVPAVVLTLGIGLLTLAFWAVVAGISGGFGMLLAAVAVVHVALFCVTALVALAVTSLVLFRRPPAASPVVA